MAVNFPPLKESLVPVAASHLTGEDEAILKNWSEKKASFATVYDASMLNEILILVNVSREHGHIDFDQVKACLSIQASTILYMAHCHGIDWVAFSREGTEIEGMETF